MTEQLEPRCIYAYTETQPSSYYPAYLNVTRRASGLYEISVRSRDTCSAGMIVLSAEQFQEFRETLHEDAP